MPELLEPADPSGRNRAVEESVVRGPLPIAPPPRPMAMDDGRQMTDVPPLLLFERVSKWYGPVIGVNQVTLELRPGITGLVGANGAGKSTLLRLATGHLRPDLGSVHVRGRSPWREAAKRYGR